MSKVGSWSTTAGSNNASPPDGFPEGQAPSTLNDAARELMASIRTLINDLQFIDQNFTPTYISATTFSVAGNQTSAIHAGRRLKLFDATTVYATVVSASYTAVTTIQLTADAATLTSSLSSFAIAILSALNPSLPPGSVTSTNALINTPVINAASMSGGTVDNLSLGYKSIPNTAISGTYEFALGDSARCLKHATTDTSARQWTIASSASVGFAIGTVLTLLNQGSAGVLTIAITTDTLHLAGTGSAGSRTIAAHGLATLYKSDNAEWYIAGTGVS